MRPLVLLSSLAGVGLAATAVTAQIANGSFEFAALPAPNRVDITALTDWTPSGGNMLLERGVNSTSEIAAHSGVQFVSMGHNSAQGDTLRQFFATTAGQVYTVSFYLHCIQGDAAQVLTASARDGDVLGQVVATIASRTQGWVNFTFDFAATGPSTELRFVHSTGAAGANIALDTVTVVPGPSGAALLGLAGLAARRRRR